MISGITIKELSKNSKKDIIQEEYKSNLKFNFNTFNKPTELKNLDGILSQIIDIIFTVPYTHPDNPYYGVGIEKYLFEYASDDVLAIIKTNIQNQITRYISADLLLDTVVEFVEDDDDAYTTHLYIGLTVKNNFADAIKSKKPTVDFFVVISKDNQNKISKIFKTL